MSERQQTSDGGQRRSAAAGTGGPPSNALEEIEHLVPGLDLWQPRDWPHREGDQITLDLLSLPLRPSSPGRRCHPCELCGDQICSIHDNVLCWKCKGTYCISCFLKYPNIIFTMGQDRVINEGWASCPRCPERFRSIALVDVYRFSLEQMGNDRDEREHVHHTSLLQEAEWALNLGIQAKDDADRSSKAIDHFTHAINAINYIASLSMGRYLVLRAKDILLISHSWRAVLEGKPELYSSIAKRYSTLSVRVNGGTPVVRHAYKLSLKKNFMTLFYPLPAQAMIPEQGRMICFDMRTSTREESLEQKFFLSQKEMMTKLELQMLDLTHDKLQNVDHRDIEFTALNGIQKGTLLTQTGGHPPCLPFNFAGEQLVLISLVQFIYAFPTKLAASEYVRVKMEKGDFRDSGMQMRNDEDISEALRSELREKFKEASWNDDISTKRVHLYFGKKTANHPKYRMRSFSIIAAVGPLATKIFVTLDELCLETSLKKIIVLLGTKLIVHMNRCRREYCDDSAPTEGKVLPFLAMDKTVCSYCGVPEDTNESSETRLLLCVQCKLTKYCSKECQKAHWAMKGSFGHKVRCVSAVKLAAKPCCLDVSHRVTVCNLQSESGKLLNGKMGVIVAKSDPTTGRFGVALMDDLSLRELERLEEVTFGPTRNDPTLWDWIPERRRKAIKGENLRRHTTMPCPRFERVNGNS